MPLYSFQPQVKSPAYDLIDQAYGRFLASQARPTQSAGVEATGGGGGGGGGQGGLTADTKASSVSQVPDFFNREQPGPVFQAPDSLTPPAPQAPQTQPPTTGGQTGGGLGQSGFYSTLLSLLSSGGHNDSPYKSLVTDPQQRQQDTFLHYNPWMAFQGQAGQQPPEIAAIFDPNNYSRRASSYNAPSLDRQTQQAAMSFLLQHIAGMNRA